MFITESTNVENSAIFMGFVRQSLAEQVKDLGGSKEQLEYVIREASDGDVLAYAMTGDSIPKDIDRDIAVSMMIEQVKTMLIKEGIEAEIDPEIICECALGLSVLDSDVNSAGLLNESELLEAIKGARPDMIKVRAAKANNDYKAGEFGTQHGGSSSMGGVGDEIVDNNERQQAADAAGASEAGGGNTGTSTQTGLAGLMATLRKFQGEAGDKVSTAWQTAKGWFEKGNNGRNVGAAVAIAVISMIGYMAYKTYKKKKEGQCAKLNGDAKKACMRKAKNEAIKAQITQYNRGKSMCKNTKDPGACRAKADKKIQVLRAKLA